jgi:hypothetical protein
MADYPFKINITTEDDVKFSFYTASFATDADAVVSSSVIVDRINNMKSGSNFVDSIEAPTSLATHSSSFYNFSGSNGISWLSASFDHPHTGSISFTDTETAASGGLSHYEFYGTKVCSVLGLPEGIKIRTENFKLSDNTSDSDNYVSGDLISNNIQLKEGLKMAPQARMRSNLIWDDAFGEGFVQWVSGSTRRAFLGYDDTKDVYSLLVSQITGSTVKATTFTGALTGNATSATQATNLFGGTVTLGEDGVISSRATNQGHNLILSASLNNLGDGGDIVLQGGDNSGGASGGTNVRGGHVIVRPGITNNPSIGFTEAGGSGTRTSGSFIVSGSSTITEELDIADGFLKLGYDAYSTDGAYVGITTSNMTGASEYMMISGKTDGNTYLSAKNTGGVYIRGGANNATNQIAVYDADNTARIDTTTTNFTVTGDVTAYYSDTRLKDKIKIGIDNPINKIKGIEVFTYKNNDLAKSFGFENDDTQIGVSAQSVQKVLPEVVHIAPFDLDKDGNSKSGEDYLTVKYEKIVPLLIESIKEQQEQIDELKKEVEELKNA